jgi:hypothetical protein
MAGGPRARCSERAIGRACGRPGVSENDGSQVEGRARSAVSWKATPVTDLREGIVQRGCRNIRRRPYSTTGKVWKPVPVAEAIICRASFAAGFVHAAPPGGELAGWAPEDTAGPPAQRPSVTGFRALAARAGLSPAGGTTREARLPPVLGGGSRGKPPFPPCLAMRARACGLADSQTPSVV